MFLFRSLGRKKERLSKQRSMEKTQRIRLNMDLKLLENLPEVVPDKGLELDPRIVALVRALARQAAEKRFSELQSEDEKEYDKRHTRRR